MISETAFMRVWQFVYIFVSAVTTGIVSDEAAVFVTANMAVTSFQPRFQGRHEVSLDE